MKQHYPFPIGTQVIIGRHLRRGRVLGPVYNHDGGPRVPLVIERPGGASYLQGLDARHLRVQMTDRRAARVIRDLISQLQDSPSNPTVLARIDALTIALRAIADEKLVKLAEGYRR